VTNQGGAKAGLVGRLMRSRELSVVVVLAVLCLAMAFTEQRASFFGSRNVTNIVQQVALLSLFAIGETIVIITSGIDLSLGSLIAFTGMLAAYFVAKLAVPFQPLPAALFAIVITLVIALAIGLLHGTLIHRLKLPPFVVTLTALLVLRSQSLVVNQQLPISLNNQPFLTAMAQGAPLWILLIVVAVVAHILLSQTRIGRYLYALGGNEQATRLSGVNIFKVKLFAYGASGLLGGLAGILWAGYGGQGNPQIGVGYELDAVASAVVGGASLTGGRGSVPGTILGATLLITILSAINLTLSSPDIWRGTVVGGVLLFAVLVTAFQQRGRSSD